MNVRVIDFCCNCTRTIGKIPCCVDGNNQPLVRYSVLWWLPPLALFRNTASNSGERVANMLRTSLWYVQGGNAAAEAEQVSGLRSRAEESDDPFHALNTYFATVEPAELTIKVEQSLVLIEAKLNVDALLIDTSGQMGMGPTLLNQFEELKHPCATQFFKRLMKVIKNESYKNEPESST